MNSKLKVIIALTAFVAFIIAASVAYSALSKRVAPPDELSVIESPGTVSGGEAAERSPAPDFTVIDADGNSVKLSDMKGKPVVLNFWASWCPPCKSEMPVFNKVSEELGDDVVFMMVDLVDGFQETQEKGAEYVAAEGFSFPVYYDTKQEAALAYTVMSIPTTIFVDKDGFIAATAKGAIDEEYLRAGIAMIHGAE